MHNRIEERNTYKSSQDLMIIVLNKSSENSIKTVSNELSWLTSLLAIIFYQI